MNDETALPKILCVDDEPGLLRSLRWLLRKRFQVAVTDNPSTGLALLAADRFDVVISDLRMPGMSGTEFLTRAKEISPRTIRLLLTGYADFGAVLASVNDAEVFRFITKPWDNDKLLQTVGDAARQARLVDNAWTDFSDTFLVDDPAEVEATILVFDAEPDMLSDVQAAAPTGTRVLWTNDIGDTIGILAQQEVAVLVTDVAVQREQQLDLIRAVRRHQPSVVVVVYSAERDTRLMARLVNEGQIYRFVSRPSSALQMKMAVRGALSQHRVQKRYPARAHRYPMAEAVDDTLPPLGLDGGYKRTIPMPLPGPACGDPPAPGDSPRDWLRG